MTIFPAKGCYYLIGNRNPYYSISPSLDIGYPTLYDSVSRSGKDIVTGVPCFDDKRVIYIFGKNFGNVQVTASILLGSAEHTDAAEAGIMNWWNTHRSANSGVPMSISTLGGGASRYLIQGIGLGGVDPNYNILKVTLTGFEVI